MVSVETLVWTAPPGWHLLSPGTDADEWIEAVVEEAAASPTCRATLAQDLRRFVEVAPNRTSEGGSRHQVAAISPDRASASRVIAGGWLELGPPVDVVELTERIRSAPLPAITISRDVDRRESRRRPAVVCRDLVALSRGGLPLLHERCAALVTDRALEVSIRIELSTSDLHAFDDIGAVCLQALDAFSAAAAQRAVR